MKKFLNKKKGQGIVEYAGALVVAAALVAAVLAIGPTGLGTMFNTVLNNIQTYFSSQIPSS